MEKRYSLIDISQSIVGELRKNGVLRHPQGYHMADWYVEGQVRRAKNDAVIAGGGYWQYPRGRGARQYFDPAHTAGILDELSVASSASDQRGENLRRAGINKDLLNRVEVVLFNLHES